LTENTTYYYDTVDSFANANFMSYMDNEINADLSVGPSNYVDPNTGATYPARVYDFNLDRGSNSTMIS
jgi:hypothetical protein